MFTVKDAKATTDAFLAENADKLEKKALEVIEMFIEPDIIEAASEGADYVVVNCYGSAAKVDAICRILSSAPRNFNVDAMLPTHDNVTQKTPLVISWSHAGYGSYKRIGIRRDSTHDYCYSSLS